MDKIDMWEIENGLQVGVICGVDEAGRGPLAGPVCAAAVILPQGEIIPGLNDSKKLTDKKRRELFPVIKEKALAYGVKLSGATVHFVSEECDGGPIILQKAVPVEEGDTPETLQRRIMEQAEWNILPQAVSLFCQDRLRVDGRIVRISR